MKTETIPLPILAACFHSFGVLLGCGVNLSRSLQLLTERADHAGLREALQHCRDRVNEGSTLSQAMSDRPAVFPTTALLLVRVGEYGGVLDETVARLARELDAEQDLRDRIALVVAMARLQEERLGAEVSERIAELRERLAPVRRQAAYCRVLGCLLGSGVPIFTALSGAAEEFAEPERSQALQLLSEFAERCRVGNEPSLAAMVHEAGILPPVAVQLFAIGEETGRLDVTMDRAAELLEHEVIGELNAALAMG